MRKRQPKMYAVLRKRFTKEALQRLLFVAEGSLMVRRGACRRVLAEASSLDGVWWRVRPLDRHWKGGAA